MFRYITPTKAFEHLFHFIMDEGEEYAGTKAVFNTNFSIDLPLEKVITTPERKFKTEYAEYEWNWYCSGNRDAKEIAEKAKIWKNMMVPYTTEVNSNYGYFWNYNDQLNRVIAELKANKETRRAVIVHYGLHELDRYKWDTPCNMVLNFYIRNNMLCLTVFARSIDLVFGFCNDQYTFAKLLEVVAYELKIEPGNMDWMITNLHIYPRHYDLLKK